MFVFINFLCDFQQPPFYSPGLLLRQKCLGGSKSFSSNANAGFYMYVRNVRISFEVVELYACFLFCQVFSKERLLRQRTWEEAEGICEEFGGHLASFAHIQEMKDFHVFLKSSLRYIFSF